MKKVILLLAIVVFVGYLAVQAQNKKSQEAKSPKSEESVVDSISNSASSLLEKTKEGASKLAADAEQAANKAVDATKEAAADAVNATENAVADVKEGAAEMAEEAQNTLEEVAAKVAKVGITAPNIKSQTIKGEEFDLANQKGQIVVLEWTNLDCPFVKKHYDSNNMQNLQKKYVGQGVTWVSIVSSAEGKQGYFAENANAVKAFEAKGSNASHVILDPSGKYGNIYQAKTTPHMYVINKEGVLAYAGAIDSIASADKDDVKAADNYVAGAIDDLMAGKKVQKPVTESYGCSVKY